MRERLVPGSVVLLLLVGALMLPVAISILFGLGRLLAAMGDAIGGTVLGWIALAAGILWSLDLICLVVVQAINSLGDSERRQDSEREG